MTDQNKRYSSAAEDIAAGLNRHETQPASRRKSHKQTKTQPPPPDSTLPDLWHACLEQLSTESLTELAKKWRA